MSEQLELPGADGGAGGAAGNVQQAFFTHLVLHLVWHFFAFLPLRPQEAGISAAGGAEGASQQAALTHFELHLVEHFFAFLPLIVHALIAGGGEATTEVSQLHSVQSQE